MTMLWDEAPCRGLPGFVQPADASGWDQLSETFAAKSVCNRLCPRSTFRACAEAALTAGTAEDGEPQIADGVVMAGVVCRGDIETAQMLRLVADLPGRKLRPDACLSCARPMTTRTNKRPGFVIHEAAGRCATCRRATQRAA